LINATLTLVIFLAVFFVNKFRKAISKGTALVDRPDKKRKLHKFKTPLLGGVMIYLTFLLINAYLIAIDHISKDNLIIFLGCSSCFIIGLIDDIKNINYKYKFFFLFIIFFLIIRIDPNLQLNKVYFHTFNKIIYFNNWGIFITILCLLLLTNALNLIDGIDGLCILVSIIFFAWILIIFNQADFFNCLFIGSLFYVLILNIKKNIFLGDSGALFLGSLIGFILILNYNNELFKRNFPVENIFITLMLPGIDMLRVFVIRISNSKNPFEADRSHLHYLLLDRGLNLSQTLLAILSLISIPISINYFSKINEIKIIVIFTIIYLFIILYLKKKKINKKKYLFKQR
jgi:UDP-GlcNAc:undecaprenyl-phosphate GlcNAc-1-phosphate transferase